MTVSGDSALFPVPEDYRELTEEEFNAWLADNGQDDSSSVRLLSDVLAEQAAAGDEAPAAPKMTAKSRAKAK
jgi:hypothetical protein